MQDAAIALANFKATYEPPWEELDAGIVREVRVLFENGIHTFESCQGSKGHSFPEPTVRFYGQQSEGFKALAFAQENGLIVTALRRVWQILDGEPVGPQWEMVFQHKDHGLQPMFGKDGMCTGFEWV